MSLRKLDSALRDNAADTPSNFQITLSTPLSGRYELKSCFICADFPNISAKNNVIPFTENGTQKTATLTPGYYTNATIAAAVTTALNNASGGFNTWGVAISPVTQRMTISATQSFTLDWGTRPTNSMARCLGYEAIDTASGLLIGGTRIVVLDTVLSFNIIIDGLGAIVNSKGMWSTFYVPMDQNIGTRSFVLFQPEEFQQCIDAASPKSQLRIRVVDDDGQPLDLQQNWQMILAKMDPAWV